MELSVLQKILRAVASSLQSPVIVILLVFIAASVFCVGWLIVEALTERRNFNRELPKLLETLRSAEDLGSAIKNSRMLKRQKKALLELTKHPGFSKKMLESLADNLYEKEHAHYDAILKLTSLLSKLYPMAGLLGTLIPLGPGIIALGNGDTYTLSVSMLTAFDTTSAGLIAAGISLVVHTIRTRWYASYMSDLETLFDCTVELVSEQCANADSEEI